jgi:tripartite-type tricarboxylate transporter receptor subunit TctC
MAGLAAALALAPLWHTPAAAQAPAARYPSKPIRLVNPFAPGGPVDVIGRAVGQELTKSWGQSIVVDNRPGAGTTIGAALVARATPDGYTLLVTSVSTAVSVSIYRNLPFDLARDFAPVALLAQTPLVLGVHAGIPVNSVRDLINLAIAKPGQLKYSSAGAGTISHLAVEYFRTVAKIDGLVHVPYKGGAPAVAAVAAGEVQAAMDQSIAIMPHARAGRLKAIAVSGAKRIDAAPEVPTFGESGLPGFEVIVWSAVFAPAGTPSAIVNTLNAEINRILVQPDIRERFQALGLSPASGTPAEFGTFLRNEIARWSRVSKEAGVKID